MALWWQWFLGVIFAMFFIFMFVVWYGLLLSLKYIRAYPRVEGVWYDETGRIKDKRAIKTIGAFSSDWKLDSPSIHKIRFKVYPKGLGKAEDREWEANDYHEQFYMDGDRRFIHFNTDGLKQSWSLEKKLLMRHIDHLSTQNALHKNRWIESETRVDKKAKDYAELAKSLIPFMGKMQGSKK